MEIKKAIEVLSNAKYADEFQGDEELTEATIMARNALEYRLPKRPIETKEIAGHKPFCCPTCKTVVFSSAFCNCCGQAIDNTILKGKR
ncbi:MAG: hypothetical protein IKR76_06570 [Ruminococcus sp.]|nr:hypothetical protein [Ruminococcus sp.]